MTCRVVIGVSLMAWAGLSLAAAPAHKLVPVKSSPQGLPPMVAAQLNPAGHQIVGPKGAVCSVWFAKSVVVKAGFKPSLTVKYPFTPGQLIGVLQVDRKDSFTDFRGQAIKPGGYTLRYGKQPEDGNHVGTSELADFLLALPANVDANPMLIKSFDELVEKSAKATGTTHPAIFSLLPVTKAAQAASLSHDDQHDFWILTVVAAGQHNGKPVQVPVRLVAIGKGKS